MTLVSCGVSSESSSDSEKQRQERLAAQMEAELGDDTLDVPSFPGGDGALMKYISSNLRYPQSAVDNNIQGKVIVELVVEKDGKVGEVKVVRGIHPDLDKEAIRVCKTMPKFNPGKDANGEPVRSVCTLPVLFKLQTGDMSETPVAAAAQNEPVSEPSTCSKCGGTGKVRCSKCGGKGKYWVSSMPDDYQVGCKKCGGHGYWVESDNNIVKGSGKMKCPKCHGTGHE